MTAFDDTDRGADSATPPRHRERLLTIAGRVRATRATIDSIMAFDKRDVEDVPGLTGLLDELTRLIDDLCATPAIEVGEIAAKADLAIAFAAYAGDQAAKIALSLAGDIVASHQTPSRRVP